MLVVLACSDHTMLSTTNPDLWVQAVTVEVPLGRAISNPNTGIGIRFTKVISDARCPSDVTCFWAGEGKVLIDIVQDEDIINATELNTNQTPVTITVDELVYSLVLIELNPYPKRSDSNKKKKFNVKIEITPVN